ncbi:Ribosomal protein L11 methyltransferase [Vitis vinifera]|uniref:ETFB lysine methyltransferase n=1 Tax=Vitis vinifera TaxID=29760 RepID=A0A438BSY7_VITVI|nr:Ribosomal protein L11 methyltransferase [Vitis vinifera]
MRGTHFFKHLSCISSWRISSQPRRLIHGVFPSPLSQRRLSSVLRNFSTSSSLLTTHSLTSPYFSVRISCPKDSADMLSEALLCFGASSTSMDEQGSDEGNDKICIDSIFSDRQDVDVCISHAADSVGLKELPSYEVRVGEQYDWIKKTQESFCPVEVTEGLWIVPEWRTPPDAHATNIILNPGFAFGTGEHPTTKLCLLLLHGLIKGERFLDYGTGSGILAIAALKSVLSLCYLLECKLGSKNTYCTCEFGAASSVGIDVDPQAITAATQNAALNKISPNKMQLTLVPPDGRTHEVVEGQSPNSMGVTTESESFDIVIANILLNPLLDLADDIVSHAKPGAVVAVSGIISEQVPYIMERYSPLLESISVTEIDDWACVCGTKRRGLTVN